jgi:ribonuclease BN (tRNA processing enzyme)
VRLTVIGCSGSFPGPDGPASCYLVEADGYRLLLDLGNGALGVLQRHIDPYTVDAVLISHLHADHCLDLCSYYVARRYRPEGPPPPIPVYGPSGTADRLARAYDLPLDPGMKGEFEFRTWQVGQTQQVGPFRVVADRVEHPVEAYGLRLEYDGRVLAYSGDTAACDSLLRLAKDANLLLCEASFLEGRDDEVTGLHLTGRQAAQQATAAGAQRLVLTHVPPWNDSALTLAEAGPAFDGPIELARSGATYEI